MQYEAGQCFKYGEGKCLRIGSPQVDSRHCVRPARPGETPNCVVGLVYYPDGKSDLEPYIIPLSKLEKLEPWTGPLLWESAPRPGTSEMPSLTPRDDKVEQVNIIRRLT